MSKPKNWNSRELQKNNFTSRKNGSQTFKAVKKTRIAISLNL